MQLLRTPIEHLNVSMEFKAMMLWNGFRFLEEVTELPLNVVPLLPQSGYRMLKELLCVLEMNGLLDLVED